MAWRPGREQDGSLAASHPRTLARWHPASPCSTCHVGRGRAAPGPPVRPTCGRAPVARANGGAGTAGMGRPAGRDSRRPHLAPPEGLGRIIAETTVSDSIDGSRAHTMQAAPALAHGARPPPARNHSAVTHRLAPTRARADGRRAHGEEQCTHTQDSTCPAAAAAAAQVCVFVAVVAAAVHARRPPACPPARCPPERIDAACLPACLPACLLALRSPSSSPFMRAACRLSAASGGLLVRSWLASWRAQQLPESGFLNRSAPSRASDRDQRGEGGRWADQCAAPAGRPTSQSSGEQRRTAANKLRSSAESSRARPRARDSEIAPRATPATHDSCPRSQPPPSPPSAPPRVRTPPGLLRARVAGKALLEASRGPPPPSVQESGHSATHMGGPRGQNRAVPATWRPCHSLENRDTGSATSSFLWTSVLHHAFTRVRCDAVGDNPSPYSSTGPCLLLNRPSSCVVPLSKAWSGSRSQHRPRRYRRHPSHLDLTH
jgi:hypothetical protein